MSKDSRNNLCEQLDEIIPNLLNGNLTDFESEQLEGILENSQEAQEYFLNCIDVHVCLQSGWTDAATASQSKLLQSLLDAKLQSQSSGSTNLLSTGPDGFDSLSPTLFQSFNGFAVQGLLGLVAFLLAANLILVWFTSEANFAGRSGAAIEPSDVEVTQPQLVSMTACVWNPDEKMPSLGQSMGFGEVLNLLEGIAELDMVNADNNSARARIEGPASVYVRSDGQIGMRYGVMTVEVQGGKGEFVIDAPMGNIVLDGSASIGIVAKGDLNQVHCFDGQVMIEPSLLRDCNCTASLNVDEAASFNVEPDVGWAVTRFEASKKAFATTRSMAFDRLNLNTHYRQTVLASDPRIYWAFDGGTGAKDISTNEKQKIDASIDGQVSWRRYGENVAAEFGLTSSGGAFVSKASWPDKALDEYAVEFWIKPSHFHNGAVLGMVKTIDDRRNVPSPHGMFFEIGGPYHSTNYHTPRNSFRFLHRSPPSQDPKDGTSCRVPEEYDVRVWQHIVANKTPEQLQLFVNGELVSSRNDSTKLAPDMRIVVGQLYPQKGDRPFIGQIDEIAIYERALSSKEIEKHFKSVHPRNTNSNLPDLSL